MSTDFTYRPPLAALSCIHRMEALSDINLKDKIRDKWTNATETVFRLSSSPCLTVVYDTSSGYVPVQSPDGTAGLSEATDSVKQALCFGTWCPLGAS